MVSGHAHVVELPWHRVFGKLLGSPDPLQREHDLIVDVPCPGLSVKLWIPLENGNLMPRLAQVR